MQETMTRCCHPDWGRHVHYGNSNYRPIVHTDDYATYRTVRAGLLRVKVLDPMAVESAGLFTKRGVRIRVTSRTNPIRRAGEEMIVSPLWLTRRDGR